MLILSSVKQCAIEMTAFLNDDCGIVSSWMSQNELCLNVDKTAGTSQWLTQVTGNQKNIGTDGWLVFV